MSKWELLDDEDSQPERPSLPRQRPVSPVTALAPAEPDRGPEIALDDAARLRRLAQDAEIIDTADENLSGVGRGDGSGLRVRTADEESRQHGRLVWILGGVGMLLLLVVILGGALGGSKKNPAPPQVPTGPAAPPAQVGLYSPPADYRAHDDVSDPRSSPIDPNPPRDPATGKPTKLTAMAYALQRAGVWLKKQANAGRQPADKQAFAHNLRQVLGVRTASNGLAHIDQIVVVGYAADSGIAELRGRDKDRLYSHRITFVPTQVPGARP
jgi:hypothetical protein